MTGYVRLVTLSIYLSCQVCTRIVFVHPFWVQIAIPHFLISNNPLKIIQAISSCSSIDSSSIHLSEHDKLYFLSQGYCITRSALYNIDKPHVTWGALCEISRELIHYLVMLTTTTTTTAAATTTTTTTTTAATTTGHYYY